MAPLPVINGIHRVAFEWRVGAAGATAANVMHFSGASVDPGGLFNALNTNVSATMWTGLGGDTAVVQVIITPLDGSSATQIFTPSGAKWAGASVAGDYLPSSAGVVSLRTAVRGRQNRGRLYIPFVLETVVSDGRFVGSLATVQAAWDTFRGAMKTASWPMHVASYGHGLHKHKNPDGSISLTPVTWTPHSNEVIANTYESALGTQRRRQSRLR